MSILMRWLLILIVFTMFMFSGYGELQCREHQF